jgi:rare lipoprotein A (peptidoglycan hydrolase)
MKIALTRVGAHDMSACPMARLRRPRRLVRRVAFASIVAAGVLSTPAEAREGHAGVATAALAQTTQPTQRVADTATRRSAAGNLARRARTPQRSQGPQCLSRGEARWYGPGFNGNRTASGEVFDMNRLTAASRTIPFGTWVRVTRLDNGRSVVVKVNDRHAERSGLVIDLSRAAAQQIGMVGSGVARVCVTRAEPPRRATSNTRVAERPPARASARNGARSTGRR